jgi:hypothetical protein
MIGFWIRDELQMGLAGVRGEIGRHLAPGSDACNQYWACNNAEIECKFSLSEAALPQGPCALLVLERDSTRHPYCFN